MRDLSAAEEHRDLHPMPFTEEVADVVHLEGDVVHARLRAHLHFLQLARGALLAGLLRLLLLRVAVLPVVHDATDGRVGGGRDLDQVELLRIGDPLRVGRRHHAELAAVGVDHADLACANLLVDADLVLDLRYDPPPGMRASAATRAMNASSATAGSLLPPTRG